MWQGSELLSERRLRALRIITPGEAMLESGDFSHSESGENRQSESNNKDQSPGLYLLN